MRLAGTRLQHHPSRVGLTKDTKAGPVWTGEVRFNKEWLTQPLRWKRPRKIFVAAHGDLFHEGVPDDVLDQVFAVMALCPQHTFQVLTKRADRMRAYLARPAGGDLPDTQNRIAFASTTRVLNEAGISWKHEGIDGPWRSRAIQAGTIWPLPNVWLGVSVEDQRRADERIPDLLATPAAVRWISAEPLLGPVDLHQYLLGFPAGHPASCACGHGHGFDRCPNYGRVSRACHRCACTEFRKAPGSDGLSWVVVGGESGPGARPMHPDWARSLRDQCAAAGVPYYFKQWGEYGTAASSMTTGQPVFRQFADFQHWVNKAPTWVNGGICLDAGGQLLRDGADFMRARDAGAFPVTIMHRVGKRSAGRLLDGVTHDGFPESGRVGAEGSRRG